MDNNYLKHALDQTKHKLRCFSVSTCIYILDLHLGDFADAFIQSDLQPFIHTFTHLRRSQPHQATASRSGAV